MTNSVLAIFLAFTISFSCFSVNAASSGPHSQSKRDLLKQQPINQKDIEHITAEQKQALDALGGDVLVEIDKRNLPSSITGKLATRENPDDPAMDALGCVNKLSSAFRRRADDGFLTSSIGEDEQGVTHVRLAQTYKGLNVVGGELTVDLTGSEVTGVKGSFIADLDLSTEPDITSDEAALIALQFASDKVRNNPKIIGNRSPVIFVDQDKVSHLAIPVQVQYGDNDETKSDDLFISATTGLVLNPRLMGAGTASPVGDFNRDGTSNGKDSVDWIRAFGIRFRTYGVTDEVYNPGIYLPRRPWDYNVKMIDDGCLSSFGVSGEQFPPDQLPGLSNLVNGFQKIPPQYLRLLGQRGYKLTYMGGVGRLAKRWSVRANTSNGFMVIWKAARACAGPSCPQYDGRIAFYKIGDDWQWEPMSIISYNGTTVVFYRPNAGQTYTANIDSSGNSITGSFSDGSPYTYSFSGNADFGGDGATTVTGSYGQGSPSCGSPNDWSVGTPANFIAYTLVNSTHNIVHEVGHFVRNLVSAPSGPFFSDDKSALTSTGFDTSPGCSGASWSSPGPPGYVSQYASCNGGEDFAETFAYYFDDRATLQARAASSSVLTGKMNFIADRVDYPDPAPSVAIHPTRGQAYSFSIRDGGRIFYKNDSTGWKEIPGGGITRMAVTAVPFKDKIYLFAVGTDDRLYYQKILPDGSFTGWRLEPYGIRFRRMVAASEFPGVNLLYVAITGFDGGIYYTTINAWDGFGSWGQEPSGVRTLHAPTLVYGFGQMYLLCVGYDSAVYFTTINSSGSFAPWALIPGSYSRTSVGAVLSYTSLYVFTLGLDYRFYYSSLPSSGWTEVPGNGISPASPALTPPGPLDGAAIYVKGLGDGNIYRKVLFDGPWGGV